MKLEEYSDKAFVVRGEYTKKYINELKSMNGRFNPKLKGGAGWIFSKKHTDKLNTFIEQKNKECGQIFFDQKESEEGEEGEESEEREESEEKIDLNHTFKIVRKNLARRNDILEFDNTPYDIEFDTMENKRMVKFNKFNRNILKGARSLKLTFMFFLFLFLII